MKRTTTRSAVAAATAAVCALAFAPAVPDLTAQPAERHVVLDGVDSAVADTPLALGVDGRIDRSALAGALGGLVPDANRLDARAHRDALRTLLTDAGATPFTRASCIDGCVEPMEPGEEYEPESYEYSYVEVYNAGDVDGDGHDDLGEAAVTFGYDAETDEHHESSDLVLRSGDDGRQLWSVLGAPGYFAAVPDVDGDGLSDLMSVTSSGEFVSESSCDETSCEDTFGIEISRNLGFVRGVDGAALQSTTLDSAFGYHYRGSYSSTGPLYDDSYSSSMFDENLVTELDFVAGGDGHQLLVGTISFEDAFGGRGQGVDAFVLAPGVRELESSFASDSLVRLLDPVSGDETVLLDSADDGRLSIPHVLRGAGADAVLVDRFDVDAYEASATCVSVGLTACPITDDNQGTESAAPTVALVDLDGTTRWETELGFESVGVVPAGGDVDGDGVADVLDLAYDEETGDDVVVLRSGADGAEVWTSSFVYGQATDAGLVGLDVGYRDDGYDLDAVTVDGDTGEIRSRERILEQTYEESSEDDDQDTFVETYAFVDFVALQDGDVDMLVETAVVEYVLVEEECYTEVDEETGEEYEFCWAYYEGQLIAGETTGRDGRDLATLFAFDLTQDGLAGIVDVDGDGDVELYVVDRDDEAMTETGTVQRLDGTVLWTVGDDLFLLGSLAVPGGVDLIGLRFASDETAYTISFEVLDGRTGAVRLELAREVHEYGEVGDAVAGMSYTS